MERDKDQVLFSTCGHPLPPALLPEGILFSLMYTFSVSVKNQVIVVIQAQVCPLFY